MYNRFIHQKQQQILNQQLKRISSYDSLHKYKQRSNQIMAQKYKERVRDFLVQVTSKPVVLGQYIPPVKNIVRNPENQKILANAQLYINGFKTNRERINKAVQDNYILDLNPTKSTALLHQFRPRNRTLEIQPGMRFMGKNDQKNSQQSKSLIKFPSLMSNQSGMSSKSGKSIKLRYKGVQEMGNNLKSMKQKQEDQIGLVNRLQTVSGGKQFDHLTFSMLALKQSKILRDKVKSVSQELIKTKPIK